MIYRMCISFFFFQDKEDRNTAPAVSVNNTIKTTAYKKGNYSNVCSYLCVGQTNGREPFICP